VSDDDVLDAFDGEVLDLIIPGTLDEIRLDRVLALLTGLSRSETSVIISSGAVTLDDKVIVKSSTPVREGRHLVAVLPAPESANVEADPNVGVDVVLDDVDFAVINKAPGQVVHPGPDIATARWSLDYSPSIPRCAISVRWDCVIPCAGYRAPIGQGTSGVLVVAKTPKVFRT